MESVALTVPQFCEAFALGRTKTYELIRAGDLVMKKVGRRSLITRESAEAWFRRLPDQSATGTHSI